MLELLDFRTLFFTGFLIAGAFAAIMFGIMRTRKTYPGYGSWAWAELAFAVLFMLQAVRGLVGNFGPVVLGNIAACCAMVFLAKGIRNFCGERGRNLWIYLASAAFLCAVLYLYYMSENFRIRTLLASSYLAGMTTYAALPLLRRAPKGRRYGYVFTATVLLFAALIGFVRVFLLARMPDMTTLFFRTPINGAFYLTDVLFIIGISFAFFLLTNERSVADLRDSNLSLAHEVKERQKAERDLHSEVTERKELEVRLKELVVTDALSGLLNRRGLLGALKDEVQRAYRLNSPLTVLVLDLDNFKNVNDTYGHVGGDQALRAFAGTCRANLRVVDTIGRVGGDEFAVLLPATDIDAAGGVAEKLRLAVESTAIQAGAVSFFLTVSIGMASWTSEDDSGDFVLAQADRALYAAKEAGRNCICIASRSTRLVVSS
jgi:diguanylate cyclase (GGDEF)-like protein